MHDEIHVVDVDTAGGYVGGDEDRVALGILAELIGVKIRDLP